MGEHPTVTDFARSFCYYVPNGYTIWVRIQAECVCQVIDHASGETDEYVLGVRTQTGLRTDPPSDALDPGYDFWMIFSRDHIFVRRTHASAHTNNPTKVPVSEFVTTGWTLNPAPARQLHTPAEVLEALQAGLPIVARTAFTSSDGAREYRIEYPVKWADGDPVRDAFRVETGPVLLLDPDRVMAGTSPAFDDFTWAYLDYHGFDGVRCLIERPTSIFSGATYPASPETPRRYPALTREQQSAIQDRLFSGWEPPIKRDALERLLETDHYSAVTHLAATTTLLAIDDEPARGAT
jgi:hypothetical protein